MFFFSPLQTLENLQREAARADAPEGREPDSFGKPQSVRLGVQELGGASCNRGFLFSMNLETCVSVTTVQSVDLKLRIS